MDHSRRKAVVAAALAVLAGVAVLTDLVHPAQAPDGTVCFAVGPGVCFSGSTAWVLRSAAMPVAMAGVSLPVVVTDVN
ncbi:MAG TPA: hypothetical protein VGC80_06610 [Acetobacteraceae bacterium]|jgi:hypothetical protein